jgi:hypothetical protein
MDGDVTESWPNAESQIKYIVKSKKKILFTLSEPELHK